MTAQPAPRSGLPILGQLSPLSRAFLIGTVALSLLAIVLDFGLHADESLLFIVSAAAILGLAWVVGLSTERLGSITGPPVGGILNATFGNIAELIIAFFALQAGLIDVVKASLTGSIVGNLLLVLGLSVLTGGLKNGTQKFSREIAGSNAALLVLAAIGLFVPAVLAFSSSGSEGSVVEAAVLLAILSEILVGAIEPVVQTLGLTAFFVGVVLLPVIGNLAEQLVAVQLAWKNKMEFSMAVSYGASLQVALFVAPALVLLGVLTGHEMNLVFAP